MNELDDPIAESQRRYEIDDAHLRVADLADKAVAQDLSPAQILRELRRPSGRCSMPALLERVGALPSTPAFRARLRALVADLLRQSDQLRLAEQHHYNLTLRALLPRLPKSQARGLVRPLINHRLKERVLPASMHESCGRPSYGHEQEDGSWHDRDRMRRHGA